MDGAAVTLDGVTVDKSAGAASNTEDGDFYGMNAALLAMNGATVTIKNATVPSSAQNGNGVFSYGGGTTSASNLVVETSGNSSAAIRSDRGGGTVNVSGGAYTSNGYNSPAVYSTADITVKNANLTANNSEALVIKGKNSITLEDCYVTGNMSDTKGTSSSENVHNVMIYQSMSGDADVGTSVFSMTGGSLVGSSGTISSPTSRISRAGNSRLISGKSWSGSRRISIRGRRTATAAGNASTALISSSGSSGARR